MAQQRTNIIAQTLTLIELEERTQSLIGLGNYFLTVIPRYFD